MPTMNNPSSFFSGGGQISGDVEVDGELLQNPILQGEGAEVVPEATVVGVNAKATGNVHSAAFARKSQATGNDATAIGTEAKATAKWNTVVGYDAGSVSNGDNIVLVGRKAEAKGDNGIAIGEVALANALNTTAVGRGAEATADRASVYGQDSNVQGQRSTAMGQNSQVSGADTTAVGQGLDISSASSVVVGVGTNTTADNTSVIGEGATATATSATAIGRNASAEAQNSTALGSDTTVTTPDSFGIGPRDIELTDTRGIVYPDGSPDQVLVDKQTDGTIADGFPVGYDLAVGGTTVATIFAESDGAGGIKNARLDVPVDLAVAGDTTQVDDLVTADIVAQDGSGNTQFEFDASVSPAVADFKGNSIVNFGFIDNEPVSFGNANDYQIQFAPTAGQSGALELVDANNTDVEAKFFIGGGIEFANQSIETKLAQGEDFFKLVDSSSSDSAQYFYDADGTFNFALRDSSAATTRNIFSVNPSQSAQLDVLGTLNFPNITGTPSFDTHAHDEGGLASIPNAGLVNNSITVSTGDGLKNGGNISLGSSITLDVEPADFAGSFLSDDGTDNLQVNIGRGLEADGTGQIQFDEDTTYTFTSDQTFNAGLNVATGQSIEDGSGNDRVKLGSTATNISDNSGDIRFSTRSIDSTALVATANSDLVLRDDEGQFQAVRYQTSANTPGTLELLNADLDVGGDVFIGNQRPLIEVNGSVNDQFALRTWVGNNYNWTHEIDPNGDRINLKNLTRGKDRLRITADGPATLYDEAGRPAFGASQVFGNSLKAYSDTVVRIEDNQFGANAVKYISSATAPGTLELTNASLRLEETRTLIGGFDGSNNHFIGHDAGASEPNNLALEFKDDGTGVPAQIKSIPDFVVEGVTRIKTASGDIDTAGELTENTSV